MGERERSTKDTIKEYNKYDLLSEIAISLAVIADVLKDEADKENEK